MVTSVKKDVNALNQIQIQKVFFILFCLYWIATLVAMAPMSVALVLLLVFVFFIQLKGRFSEFKNTWKLNLKLQRYAWITIVLTTVCVLSVLSSWYHWDSSQRLKDLLKLGKLWHFYVPLVLAWAWSQQTPLDRDRIWQVYFFLAAIISVLGVIEHFTGFLYPRPIHSNPGRFHTQVFFKFHLSYASIMIFPFFLLLDYPRMRTAVKIPILLIGFLGLVFTYSRTLWMALPVGLILWFWFDWNKKNRMIRLVLLSLMLLLGAYFFQSGVIQRRFSENYGATPRQQLWSAHLEGFRSNPVLGVGFRKTTEYLAQLNRSGKVDLSKSIISHPHSNYFEFLVGTGILGISVLFMWIGYTGYLAYQLEEKGLFCAWIVFWLNGLTQVNLLEGKVIHQAMLMVGVSLGAWLIHGKNPKSLFSKY